jgi:N4-gp56 family major capsid protein
MGADGNLYNNPVASRGNAATSESSMGKQFNTQHWIRKALIDAAKDQYFSPLANVIGMPKHFGKKIVRYMYLPLLDDKNINSQGIDAKGVITEGTSTFIFGGKQLKFASNANAISAAAAINTAVTSANTAYATATGNAVTAVNNLAAAVDGTTNTLVNLTGGIPTWDRSGAEGATSLVGGSPMITNVPTAAATTLKTALDALALVEGEARYREVLNYGNLYGSSKDIGYISGKMPLLSETGGRVNRVGFTRKEISGSFEKYGFFYEWSQDSMQFDTDDQLYETMYAEAIKGANEINEDLLQLDLLHAANTIVLAGTAANVSAIDSVVTYKQLMALSIRLDALRCPKQTKIMKGSQMTDTRIVGAGRIMYIGSELIPTIRYMKDEHLNPAFIPVHKYANQGDAVMGEIGTIDMFRVVVVPEMMFWEGAGKQDASVTDVILDANGDVNIYPMLVVGNESFSTIGFQMDKSEKFSITVKKPGKETADRNDPYGEMGFSSIKWFYGFLAERPERIALVKTAAAL